MSHHVLIAGTGRAGTTFLVQLSGACGLDTGADRLGLELHPHANAGLEVLPNAPGDLPYVIKSPWSHLVLEDAITRCGRTFDHLLIPMRNLEDAAESRVMQDLAAIHRGGGADEAWPPDSTWDTWGVVPGGITYSLEPLDQARILAVALHRQLEVAVRYEIPITFLDFPRVVEDAAYAYRGLAPLIGEQVSEDAFGEAFAAIADRSKVRVGAKAVEEAKGSSRGSELAEVDTRAMRMALASTRGEMRSAQDHVDALQQQLDAVQHEKQAASAELASMAAQADALEAQARERDSALQEATVALHDVLHSPSWRVTQPLRSLKALVRRR